MSAAGIARAQEFSWERVTAKVDDYYGVVIRRLAAQGQLPPSFTASIPLSPRAMGPGANGARGGEDLADAAEPGGAPEPAGAGPRPEATSRSG
jgi:hypothetical protein